MTESQEAQDLRWSKRKSRGTNGFGHHHSIGATLFQNFGTMNTMESHYENGSTVLGGLSYAFIMIPSWLEPWAWCMLSIGFLLTIPHYLLTKYHDGFWETIYFTLVMTLSFSLLQELWLQTEYRFCKGCRGSLPHWKKWGPFYCIIIASFAFLIDPLASLYDVHWMRYDCGIVFFKQPFSMECGIDHPGVQYYPMGFLCKFCIGVPFLWFGLIWATDIFNNFLGDYLDARTDQIYNRVRNESDDDGWAPVSSRGYCVC